MELKDIDHKVFLDKKLFKAILLPVVVVFAVALVAALIFGE